MENAHIITDKQTETQNRRKLRDYNISHVNSFARPPYQLGSVHGSFASFTIVSLYFFRLPSSYHFTVHSYVFFSSSLCDSVPPTSLILLIVEPLPVPSSIHILTCILSLPIAIHPIFVASIIKKNIFAIALINFS